VADSLIEDLFQCRIARAGCAGYSHARHPTGVNRAATFVDDENRMNELALLVEVVDSRDLSVHP
jgi:hypothetical protein